MSYETFIDVLRLIDAVLATLVFGVLCYRGRRFFREYTNAQKWLYASFTLYALAASYTSFELYGQDVEIGLRSYFVLAANLAAIYALTRHRDRPIIGEQRSHIGV